MIQFPVKHALLIAAVGLTFGIGCKKKQEEVVDVESPKSGSTTSTDTTPEPTPSKNEKPDVKKDKGDKMDKKTDTSNKGGSASGEAWLKKASGSLAKAFVTRNRDGVYAASSKSKEVQIKLERLKGGKVQSKKSKVGDAKVFTQCLISGPSFKKCPIKELPIKNNKAGSIESCDAECCKFSFKKDMLKPATVFMTKACFKKPSSSKERPKLKAIKLVIGG